MALSQEPKTVLTSGSDGTAGQGNPGEGEGSPRASSMAGRPAQGQMHEAKRRLLGNVGSNVMAVVVNALIGIWLTPYLIRNLGLGVYGMVPFVTSFMSYFRLLPESIGGSVTRFVAIHWGKGEIEQTNTYFTSALCVLLGLCGVLLLPAVLLALVFSRVFQVPEGSEAGASWLFLCVMLSAFMYAVSSPYRVSTFLKHRFDLSSLAQVLGRCLRVGLLLLFFTVFSPSLEYVGLSFLAMATFDLAAGILFARRLTPELRPDRRLFKWSAIREMGHMSVWITVNTTAALLYIGVSLMLINLFLGPEQCGRYAPIAQLAALLASLGGTISSVFVPIAFEYIAQGRMNLLVLQMRRSTKFLGLIMALPVGLMCGLAAPLLTLWLGPDFASLDSLVWLLVGPWLITIAIKPMFSIYRGLDRVKVPALVALVMGVVHVLLSVALLHFTDLGIYGVALSLLLCQAARNLVFTPVYAAFITKQPRTIFIRELVPGAIMGTLVALAGRELTGTYGLGTTIALMTVCLAVSAAYAAICYGVLLSKDERALLMSFVYRRRRS